MDAALLARAHADGLAVLHIAHGVGLGVFQGDERRHQVDFRAFGQLLVLGDDVIQVFLGNFQIISPLLKGHAIDSPALQRIGGIIGVNLNHIIVALFLGFENRKGLVRIAGSDDAVGHLGLEIGGGGSVAHVRQRRPVAIGAQTIRAPGTNIRAGDGA